MTKSLGETCTLDTENIAAMLAIIGREEQSTSSPTATIMLGNLKGNLKIIFDKLISRDSKFATIRLGGGVQLDEHWFEYALVPKTQGITKLIALSSVLNSLQQEFLAKELKVIATDEGPHGYEFVVEVNSL